MKEKIMETQKIQTDESTSIGVLLFEVKSRVPVGFIKFDPRGILVYQIALEGMHVFAFKACVAPAVENWSEDPLYIKYQGMLKENPELPDSIIEQEANDCAEFLNNHKTPLHLGKYIVQARKVVIKKRNTPENLP
jgi:hypothetical protein